MTEKMNRYQLKKFRKQARKTAEEMLPLIIKPRPKWMPRFLWRLGAKIYFRDTIFTI